MSEYTLKQSDLGPLSRCHTAYYSELCIMNACSSNIVIVDVEGTKKTIEPVGSVFNNQTVVLYKRETMASSTAYNGASIPLPGITVEVPYFKLRSGPVYVEEFNVVVCTPDDAETCRHPHQAMSYTEAIHQSLEMMSEKICDAPGFRLLANDPTGRYDELYTLLNSQVTTIPVTHLSDKEFILTIVVINNGKYHADSINVNSLLEGTENIVEFNNQMIPFVTTSKANAESISKTFMWLNPKTFTDFQARTKKECEEAIAAKDVQLNALKAEKDAKLKELNAKVTSLNATVVQVQSERDDFKTRYQALKGNIDATNDMMSAYRDQNKFATDLEIARNDREMSQVKMQHQKDEATYKTWHLITAAVLPAVVAIIIELIRSK